MFSKEESAKIRKEFWTQFGKEYQRKWLLYKTGVKGLVFKFNADRKKASVSIDFEHTEAIANDLLYDQFISLQNLIVEAIPEIIFDDSFILASGHEVKRIYIPHDKKFSIHNKNTWTDCYEFFYDYMNAIELFYFEYKDFIEQAV